MKQRPLILALETSGRIGSVAIGLGEKLLAQTRFSGLMRHSSEIFPSIQTLLQQFGKKAKDIEQLYISAGPGSFTGLRIAVTLAKTLNLANNIKIVAVETLDVIAANSTDYIKGKKAAIEKIATIVDAKRGQFFVAVYQVCSAPSGDTEYRKILPASLMTPLQFLERFAGTGRPIWLLGEGLVYYKGSFKAEGISFMPEKYWSPQATKVHQLGWEMSRDGKFADPLTLQPIYLRRPEAEQNWLQNRTQP